MNKDQLVEAIKGFQVEDKNDELKLLGNSDLTKILEAFQKAALANPDELEKAKSIIAKQQAELKARTPENEHEDAKKTVVKVNKKFYEITSGCRYKSKEDTKAVDYTKKELADKKNIKVLKELIAKGSGIIKVQEQEETED